VSKTPKGGTGKGRRFPKKVEFGLLGGNYHRKKKLGVKRGNKTDGNSPKGNQARSE